MKLKNVIKKGIGYSISCSSEEEYNAIDAALFDMGFRRMNSGAWVENIGITVLEDGHFGRIRGDFSHFINLKAANLLHTQNKTERKLLPFDLEKALNGAKLVTRDGREVKGFGEDGISARYPYSATVDETTRSYTKDGIWMQGKHKNVDLFILDETPAPDMLPNYKRMYEMLEVLSASPRVYSQDRKKIKELLLTAKID